MYNKNINLNLYKTFYDVAKSESISEAAKKTFTSQPAISKSIKKLEETLNVKLFYRNLDGIKLTSEGEKLLFYVEEAFNNLLVGERNITENEKLQSGKLNIGVPSQIGTFFVFDSISKFHKIYPNIEITIISSSTKSLLKKLKLHEIDFIIDSSPINDAQEDVIIRPLKKVDNCFIVSKKYEDKIKNIKSLKDIENYPLILPVFQNSFSDWSHGSYTAYLPRFTLLSILLATLLSVTMTTIYMTPTIAQVCRLFNVFPTIVLPTLVSSGKPMIDRIEVSFKVMINWLIIDGIMVRTACGITTSAMEEL